MDAKEYRLDFEKPLKDLETQLESFRKFAEESKVDMSGEIKGIEDKLEATRREVYGNLSAWQRIQIARHPKRLYGKDYLEGILDRFEELHGDRRFGDDPAMITGIGQMGGRKVAVIAQEKGRDTREKVKRNFGMPHPEGYRKAMRIMYKAEKFGLPVVCLVDTAGAAPGIGSEERHVSEAIALNLREMSQLEVPIVAAVIGEGGSGGALGISVANRILIFEHAYYATISPEGCAAILWKDRAFASRAAEAMKLQASNLVKWGIADEILPEPLGGTHRDPEEACRTLKTALLKHIKELGKLDKDALLEDRYQKFRAIGAFDEN